MDEEEYEVVGNFIHPLIMYTASAIYDNKEN